MCGIAGFFGPGDEHDLGRMTDVLTHRGPDDQGIWWSEELHGGLGHRRLAIRDIAGGHQPMWNEDHTVAVVFNGELYDINPLWSRLVQAGHQFTSDHSDTEVLVHGWEEWGESLPSMLNGMFAFAVLDLRRRTLFLARDRFGEKPLYWGRQGNLALFGSECTSLLCHSHFSPALDEEAIERYFAWGYIPSPRSLYTDIRKLEPGSSLLHDLSTGKDTITNWWRFRIEPDAGPLERPQHELEAEFRRLMNQAVDRRLVSDVPIGVFLSGGLDSSTVLAAACESMPAERIRAFTVGFEEASYDESDSAALVAKHFGVQHDVEMLRLSDAIADVPGVLERMDEPLADASVLPTWLLSRFTRKHVTVALSGDGGDELLAGYDPFAAFAPASIYHAIMPDVLHRGLEAVARRLPRSNRNMSLDFKIRRTLMGLRHDPSLWCPVWMGPLDPADRGRLFQSQRPIETLLEPAIQRWEQGRGLSRLERGLDFFTRFYLTEDILLKVDRATMMSSLESRAVFLDNDLVDFCRTLPIGLKYRRGVRKYLLRQAWRDVLPMEIIDRPKKGFGIPLAQWLRDLPSPADGIDVPGLDRSAMMTMWDEHRAGRADHRLAIWAWLSLQGVLRNHRRVQADRREVAVHG